MTLRLVEQLDVEEPGDRPNGMPHHHLYRVEREHPRTLGACDVDDVSDTWLVRVFGIAKILARRIAQLVAEPHDRKLTSRTPW